MLFRRAMRLLPAILLLGWSTSAAAVTIDFDDLSHGELVTDQYLASLGVTIEGTNVARPQFSGALVYDTTTVPTSPKNQDLTGPPWASGNLSMSVLANTLVIPGGLADADHDGLVDNPTDEGQRPAGFFTISFADPISSFGLDLVDIDLAEQMGGALEFYSGGMLLGSLTFEDLAAADASIVLGNNSANRVAPILASMFQASSFDQVIVQMGGSGAIDNLEFQPTSVPEPALSLLLGAGLALAARRRRARR